MSSDLKRKRSNLTKAGILGQELAGKRVLVRVDFNVPFKGVSRAYA
jgi:3-phosphoglycerate kinase